MASRRDLFQSYQFMIQRVVSSVVLRETDPLQSPLRRMGGAAFASVMIAVISLAAAGVIGLVKPGGNKTWRDGAAVIVDSSSGAQYVYLKDSSGEFQLHPVPNLASGALLIGTPDTVDVASRSLDDVPRAAPMGIVGAPDALPAADQLSAEAWTLCSLRAENISGEELPNTSLSIGRTYTEGADLGDNGVLVRDTEAGGLYLVANGRRYAIPQEAPVLDGLGLRNVPQIRVGSAWISAIPAGQDLAPVPVAGAGSPSSIVDGGYVGQVRSVATPDRTHQYYLVLADQLQPLTQTQAMVTVADPALAVAYPQTGAPTVLDLSPAVAASAPKVPVPEESPADLPAAAPEMMSNASDRATVCASYESSEAVPSIAVEARVEGAEMAPATESRTQNGTVLADRVQVDGGSGVLVQSMLSPGSTDSMLYLVTDRGQRFAIIGEDARGALGYQNAAPVAMPASLVARIPEGPALDPAAARTAI